MTFRNKKTPHSYFIKINNEIWWVDILQRCGIKFRKKQRRPELLARCVFHIEKTASLSFNESKGLFHCFGCGKSGDKFDFAHNFLGNYCYGANDNKVKTYHWFKKNFNIPLPWEKSNGKYIYR